MALPDKLSFNPRPRVEGDTDDASFIPEDAGVSIRALAWRATLFWNDCGHSGAFQSAPSRGGRPPTDTLIVGWSGVSIRALAWRATPLQSLPFPDLIVSIRALAWRATQWRTAARASAPVSIRALAWRATFANAWPKRNPQFQSAPSRGGRPRDRRSERVSMRFNPRPRVEGDPIFLLPVRSRRKVSIRALAWRATAGVSSEIGNFFGFNPRPRVEGD